MSMNSHLLSSDRAWESLGQVFLLPRAHLVNLFKFKSELAAASSRLLVIETIARTPRKQSSSKSFQLYVDMTGNLMKLVVCHWIVHLEVLYVPNHELETNGTPVAFVPHQYIMYQNATSSLDSWEKRIKFMNSWGSLCFESRCSSRSSANLLLRYGSKHTDETRRDYCNNLGEPKLEVRNFTNQKQH